MSSTDPQRVTPRADPGNDEALAAIYAEVTAKAGAVPRLYQALGASPPLLQGWIDFAWALREDAKSPRALRELMILRAAQLAGSDYVWRSHLRLALSAGASAEQVDALPAWSSRPDVFASSEQTALALVDELARGGSVSDLTWRQITKHFDEAMAVELVLTVSWYQHVARVVSALGVPLEDHHAKVAPVPGGPTA